jgi:glycosyltransferase involved in cell wall biosynthesis
VSLARMIKKLLRPVTEPLLRELAARVSKRQSVDASPQFDLNLFLALRAVADRKAHRVLLPQDAALPHRRLEDLKIGFFGNIANNAYNFVRCLRRLGYDAELVIEDGWFDTFLMNRPFWEDLEVTCRQDEDGLAYESTWVQPAYVRRVAYTPALQQQFQGRYGAIPEVQALYRQTFGLDIPSDTALILAQQMGHWPYLLAMSRYDVIQLSGAPISMGLFCPKPYVVFPTGSDLFISPFEETMLGMLMRAGYRSARHLLVCETNYPDYLSRLDLTAPQTFAPMMVDTDTYAPGKGGDIRDRWVADSGGERFILGVCRQSWLWKGSDRLVRGFHTFIARPHNRQWRLVLVEWGSDVDRTKGLISELKLEPYVLWERLASKPVLRKYQQAADLVADQFVMAGYGTSVLESMAAGRAVVMRPAKENTSCYLPALPPFLGATGPDDICVRFEAIAQGSERTLAEAASLEWVRRQHGYTSVADRYLQGYRSALADTMQVTA